MMSFEPLYCFIFNCGILWDKSLVNGRRGWKQNQLSENGCQWTSLSTLEKWHHGRLYRSQKEKVESPAHTQNSITSQLPLGQYRIPKTLH